MKVQLRKYLNNSFTRLDFASLLIVIVFALMVVGSLFPQEPAAIANDSVLRQAWENALRSRYGPITSLFQVLGIFHFAFSPLFLVAIGLLCVMTVICTFRRWRGIWSEAFNDDVECRTTFSASTQLCKTIEASTASTQFDALRRELRKRRYHVRGKTIGDIQYIKADRYQFAFLGTLANHLAVPLLLIAVGITTVFSTSTTLTVGPGEQVAIKNGTDWAVQNDGFRVLYHADGSPSSFEALVTPYKKSIRLTSRLLHVNEPLIVGRYTLYLSSYLGSPGRYGIVLIAARDPGFFLFLAAGLLMLIGLTIILLFPHRTIFARYGPENKLFIAGEASRYAFAFDDEFRSITSASHINPDYYSVEV